MKKFFGVLIKVAVAVFLVAITFQTITNRISNTTQFYRRIFGKSDIIKRSELVGNWFIQKVNVEFYEYGNLSNSHTTENTGEMIFYNDGTGVTIIYADKDTLGFEWSLQGNKLGSSMTNMDHIFTHYREVTKFENDQLFLRGVLDRDESSKVIMKNVLKKVD